MKIKHIPILEDNYSYLIIDEVNKVAGVIDPAEPEPIIRAIEEEQVELSHILCTHHHWDHSGGNEGMLKKYPKAVVVGSEADADKIPGISLKIGHQDQIQIGNITGKVLFVPCHTRGHIAYHFEDALFCGDTLFIAGCGRFFEGEAAEMHNALNIIFGELPEETRVFCGHEYTVSNLQFALSIEPENKDAQEKINWAKEQRAKNLPTIPSTLKEERSFNPFMRVSEDSVAKAVGKSDPVSVMAELRRRKNEFRAS